VQPSINHKVDQCRTEGASMKKTGVLKIVNIIIAILLVNQVVMGLLHDKLPGEVFEVLHEGGGIVFAMVAIFHVILNWNWIKANFFGKQSIAKV
jgi:hypothetical protein